MSKDGGRGGKPFNKKLLLQGGGGELIFNDGGEGRKPFKKTNYYKQ